MAKVMTLPKIGVNMTEAVVDKWAVKPGDEVKEGDVIFLAETDKATQDIYATESGIVGKLLAQEGDRVQIHEPILVLLEKGEKLPGELPAQDKSVQATEAPKAASPEKAVALPKLSGGRIRISPLAKKMARELGLDVACIKPGAEGKRIVARDVLGFAEQKKTQSVQIGFSPIHSDGAVLQAIPMSKTRKVIAERMSRSNLEKPCAALTLTACADEIIKLRERFKKQDIKVSYNDILVKIAARALAEYRYINSVLEGDEIHILQNINIGVAMDSERGLLVPVIKNADSKNIRQIAQDFTQKVTAINENRISLDDLTGGTFTITNLGMFEIEQFTPVINPPECCILAVGAIKKTFVPDEDLKPVLASTMQLTLVFDHRIVDGAPAAKFLLCIKRYIECPELLL